MKARLAIFASGSGTNAEQIMKHFHGSDNAEVACVISNNKNAFVLERAKKFNVPTKVFSRDHFQVGDEVMRWLLNEKITHIVLAGFMLLMPTSIIRQFPNRIINIHPALLPKFGGKGMYGNHVHEAVKASKERTTGITVHLVNEKYDEGKVLFQASCDVRAEESAEQIAEKVHILEHKHYPTQIEKWVRDFSD
jgi:phosphoribosylglycinamide formyltransferase 1